jgi:hypothetical protein
MENIQYADPRQEDVDQWGGFIANWKLQGDQSPIDIEKLQFGLLTAAEYCVRFPRWKHGLSVSILLYMVLA